MNGANSTKCNTFVNLCHVETYGLTTRHSDLTHLIAPNTNPRISWLLAMLVELVIHSCADQDRIY